ncbi:hypothetical protein [Desulfuribacillus alkaliarsenatis]|uniref:Uncharacterized protein n=1 Tax=Desulfuribacillus alkaliarsenatis TaxID=766136 RepID=A0A1E5G3S1_9FIRM|nr:hypothetical protein [Desulfuribacillus alkaliarsenatis]OEF97730.1 hypothetical protein BHF68_14125 [Desulfuribacillus alkaliarsenatis]
MEIDWRNVLETLFNFILIIAFVFFINHVTNVVKRRKANKIDNADINNNDSNESDSNNNNNKDNNNKKKK